MITKPPSNFRRPLNTTLPTNKRMPRVRMSYSDGKAIVLSDPSAPSDHSKDISAGQELKPQLLSEQDLESPGKALSTLSSPDAITGKSLSASDLSERSPLKSPEYASRSIGSTSSGLAGRSLSTSDLPVRSPSTESLQFQPQGGASSFMAGVSEYDISPDLVALMSSTSHSAPHPAYPTHTGLFNLPTAFPNTSTR